MQINLKIKLDHPLAIFPEKLFPSDAGLDLTCVDFGTQTDKDYIEYDTGLCLEIPEGWMGLLFPRSSVSNKGLTLCNSVGVIDSSYRGRIKVRFRRNSETNREIYKRGDRICQLILLPVPQLSLEQAEDLSPSPRGEGGFGSTGESNFTIG